MDNKIKNVFFLAVFTLITTNCMAGENIYISENFLNHPYCKNIEKISIQSIDDDKVTLLRKLKIIASKKGANTIINLNYDSGFFGTKSSIRGIAANCDIDKSPELFFKSSKNISNEQLKLFGAFTLIKDNVKVSKNTQANSTTEDISSFGVSGKLGIIQNNLRYYVTAKLSSGVLLLASADYMFKINDHRAIDMGFSIGKASYELKGNDNINSNVYGIELGVRQNNFELGFQQLFAKDSTIINNIEYKLDNISLIYFEYYF